VISCTQEPVQHTYMKGHRPPGLLDHELAPCCKLNCIRQSHITRRLLALHHRQGVLSLVPRPNNPSADHFWRRSALGLFGSGNETKGVLHWLWLPPSPTVSEQ